MIARRPSCRGALPSAWESPLSPPPRAASESAVTAAKGTSRRSGSTRRWKNVSGCPCTFHNHPHTFRGRTRFLIIPLTPRFLFRSGELGFYDVHSWFLAYVPPNTLKLIFNYNESITEKKEISCTSTVYVLIFFITCLPRGR